jgi:hypothetical protein
MKLQHEPGNFVAVSHSGPYLEKGYFVWARIIEVKWFNYLGNQLYIEFNGGQREWIAESEVMGLYKEVKNEDCV